MQQSQDPKPSDDFPPAWRHGRFRKNPPRWWPEGEPWPPQATEDMRHWRRMRGRFFWRIGFALVIIMLVGSGLFTALFWWIASATGMVHVAQPGSWFLWRPLGGFVFVLGALGLALAVRGLRRTTVPLGDVMEASARVADGDYTARVPDDRGPDGVRDLARSFNTMAERLQDNDAQRRALLADVTHELRTPITIIQGNLEGILDGIYPADNARVAAILEETRVLSRIIDDLRTLSLAESGALKLQREPVDLGELVWEAVKPFEAQAAAAQVSLAVEAQPDLPSLEIDATRIREVLTNLLANALRYTPSGGAINVRVWAEDGKVWVAVRDSGAGIAPVDLPHIFDRFYKSADSRGTGLGLSIAKNLVAAHGGAITARSDPGQGTEITFWLPA